MADEWIAVDIGGTNARFCIAHEDEDGRPVLHSVRKYRVADYPSLSDAWNAFARDEGKALPDSAAIALAAPITGGPVKLTNSHWVVDTAVLKQELNLSSLVLVNDFEAMAHGVAALRHDELDHLSGSDENPETARTITVIGPGTGLGVALVTRTTKGTHIIATEGGHVGFAPVDEDEDWLLGWFRNMFGRVSTERLVSGPGLNLLYQAMAKRRGIEPEMRSDGDLWAEALGASDGPAYEALLGLCKAYGSVAGDLALAHGSSCVVLAGGLTTRMKGHPCFGEFHKRFIAKGRYRDLMGRIPVYHASRAELGLFGAAVAGQSTSD